MSDLPVIVTRSEPGASETAQALEARGLSVILSPAIALQRSTASVPSLSDFGGVIFTSANGVRFLEGESDIRNLLTWCVGPATAAAARRAGYSPVHQSSGDAEDLAAYITQNWPTGTDRRALHVANSAARGALRRSLEAEGFEVTYVPLYDAVTAPALAQKAEVIIRNGDSAIVLIHSAKGARAFIDLCKRMDLSGLSFVAISDQAAQPVFEAGHESVIIAGHPDEVHLLAALDEFIAGR